MSTAQASGVKSRLQISNGMFIAMIVNLIYVKSIGVTQGVVSRLVGQDMWIVTLLGTLQGVAVMYIVYLVVRRTPGKDWMAAAESMLGKWFGKVVALLIFTLFFAGFGPIMITYVYHLHEYFLPEAPISLIVIASLVVGAIGCYYGLEVMARLALAGLFFIFLLNILIVIGSIDEFDILNLLPVMENGFPKTLSATIHFDADWGMATTLAGLTMPMLRDHAKQGGKVGMIGILLSGLLIIIWSILEAAVLSAEVTSQYTLSCMKLAHNAHIGHFLQRYEMIMIALYSLPILFEVMFALYGCSVATANILGVKSYKKLVLPVGALLGAFGIWIVEDHFRAMTYLEQYWPKIAMPIAVGLPLLLLLVGAIMRKKLSLIAERERQEREAKAREQEKQGRNRRKNEDRQGEESGEGSQDRQVDPNSQEETERKGQNEQNEQNEQGGQSGERQQGDEGEQGGEGQKEQESAQEQQAGQTEQEGAQEQQGGQTGQGHQGQQGQLSAQGHQGQQGKSQSHKGSSQSK